MQVSAACHRCWGCHHQTGFLRGRDALESSQSQSALVSCFWHSSLAISRCRGGWQDGISFAWIQSLRQNWWSCKSFLGYLNQLRVFVWLRYNNLYLLAQDLFRSDSNLTKTLLWLPAWKFWLDIIAGEAVTQRNSNATLIVAFLYRLAEVGDLWRSYDCNVVAMGPSSGPLASGVLRVSWKWITGSGPERLFQRARRGEHKGLRRSNLPSVVWPCLAIPPGMIGMQLLCWWNGCRTTLSLLMSF